MSTARPDRAPWWRVRASEALLLAVTLVAVAGFARLFVDRSAVLPLLVAAAAAHLVSAAARRAGLGPLATAGVTVAGFALQASVVLYPHTSVLGLPSRATLELVGDDLRAAWELFDDVSAPAPRSRGFLFASTAATWLVVALADWAAARLRATAEAVLPAVATFTFTAILGAGSGGVVLAAALAAAIGAFAVAQRAEVAVDGEPWVAGAGRRGSAALARGGAVLVGATAVLAGVLVPHLPGATSEAVVDWRAGDDEPGRVTVSPLVDIRSRLVQQSDRTVFTVEADRPAYWRLTSLDRFDGQVWSSSESFSRADGRLPGEPPDAATTRLEQTFRIRRLGTIWAPGALTPVELVRSSSDLRWNGGLATLIVPATRTAIDGMSYTLVSEVPDLRPEDLDAELPPVLPADLAAATELPADLPEVVRRLAAEVVADAGPSPYEQALALQDWFRREFTYDLGGTRSGHSGSAIEAFLAARRGYCEQFAGTYAAMARSLGLPARVAVGFTPGDPDEDGDGYTVRGRNAHAWPEVHIPGAGWVPFEPTPGRGQPGTEAYTGVPPAQDEREELPEPSTTTTAPTPGSTTAPGDRTQATVPPGERAPAAPAADGGGDGGPGGAGGLLAVVAAVAAVALVVDVVGIAAWRAARRRRRATGHGRARVAAAWQEVLDALARRGTRRRPAETDQELARRAAPDLGPDGPALVRLADLVTASAWGVDATGSDDAAEAAALSGRVVGRVQAGLGWGDRVRGWVDPRVHGLVPAWPLSPRRDGAGRGRGRWRPAASPPGPGRAATG